MFHSTKEGKYLRAIEAIGSGPQPTHDLDPKFTATLTNPWAAWFLDILIKKTSTLGSKASKQIQSRMTNSQSATFRLPCKNLTLVSEFVSIVIWPGWLFEANQSRHHLSARVSATDGEILMFSKCVAANSILPLLFISIKPYVVIPLSKQLRFILIFVSALAGGIHTNGGWVILRVGSAQFTLMT